MISSLFATSPIAEEILKNSRTIAVVGISANPERPSHRVADYLKVNGYIIIPVNPAIETVLDEKSYPDLNSISGQVDVVDIFRKSEKVLPIVQEAVKIGARTVWMQEGVINEEAADYAREAGLNVVMNKCMLREHQRFFND